MKTAFLSKWEIQQMAEAALTSYEFSCCWNRAFQEAAEYAADEFGVKSATAVRLAQSGWEGIRQSVKSVTYTPN